MKSIKRKRRGEPLVKGCWFLNQHAEVIVSCPECGGLGNLNSYKIMPLHGTAVVYPSLICGCGFHEDIALTDWDDDGKLGEG